MVKMFKNSKSLTSKRDCLYTLAVTPSKWVKKMVHPDWGTDFSIEIKMWQPHFSSVFRSNGYPCHAWQKFYYMLVVKSFSHEKILSLELIFLFPCLRQGSINFSIFAQSNFLYIHSVLNSWFLFAWILSCVRG